MQQNNTAKFTFFYLLSLVSLGFFAISAGIIIFQIINKNIVDIVETYSTRYSIEALRFALSAMIVSAPIYFVSVWQINKNLVKGILDNNSVIRKWLTYLILLITSFVMIGWAISIINNFLNGELTTKFILKALAVLIIAGITFSYYFYDIKRENLQDKKDKVITSYFYAIIVIAIVIFISGILFVESPKEARERRIDRETVNRMVTIENAIQQYYKTENKLPENLEILNEDINFLNTDDLENPLTKKQFYYNIVDSKKYELCTDFLRESLKDDELKGYPSYTYPTSNWEYEKGYDCVERKMMEDIEKQPIIIR